MHNTNINGKISDLCQNRPTLYPPSIFITAIFEKFNAEEIEYCVLRGYEALPDNHGNDLDILVSKSDLRRVSVLLADIAGDLGWCKIAEVRRYGYSGLYFSPPNLTNRWLLVDLFTETHWRGLSYVSKDIVLKGRIKYKDFYVASHGGEAAILLVKELLPWGKVKSKNNSRHRIQYCIDNDPSAFIASLQPHFGSHTTEYLLQSASNGDWQDIENRVQELRRKLLLRSLSRHPLSQLHIWTVFILGHLKHSLRKPLGLFVVLIGPDGSGKTTIAKAFGEEWQRTVPPGKEPEYIHGDFRLLPRLRIIREFWSKIRGRKLPQDPDYTVRHSGAEVVPHGLLRSLLYLGYYSWGYIWGHYKIFKVKSHDRLIIADRYFYDYFFQRGNMKLPHWLLRFLSRFIPQPDLIVFLDADAETIYQRKDELTIEEIKRQQNIIKKICKWLPNCVSIDTREGISTTAEKIKTSILSKMAEKNT